MHLKICSSYFQCQRSALYLHNDCITERENMLIPPISLQFAYQNQNGKILSSSFSLQNVPPAEHSFKCRLVALTTNVRDRFSQWEGNFAIASLPEYLGFVLVVRVDPCNLCS
jgi:hypothetical protein